MASSGAPNVRTCLCHRLLRARDWQDRPQLEAVCRWWRGGGPGVCSLVGIGGAGKTAVADRFLQLLPGATEESPGRKRRGERENFLPRVPPARCLY
ncbi:MAG: P-loop NTPase family protein [Planctomycetota bacterium]|jgi:hypothetical protein